MENKLKILKPVEDIKGYHAVDRDGKEYHNLHQGGLKDAHKNNQALKETPSGRYRKVSLLEFSNKKNCTELTKGVLTNSMDVVSKEFNEFQAIVLNKTKSVKVDGSRKASTSEQIASLKELERWARQVNSWVYKSNFDCKRGVITIAGIRGYEVHLITILSDGTIKFGSSVIGSFGEFDTFLKKNGQTVSYPDAKRELLRPHIKNNHYETHK